MPVDQLPFGWYEEGATSTGQTGHSQSIPHRRNQNQNHFEYFYGTLFDGQQYGGWKKCIQNGFNQSGQVRARISLSFVLFKFS